MNSQAAANGVSVDAKNWAVMSHLSAFVMFLGIPAIVGPLVTWLVKKEDPYVDYHGKEAVNFNISFMIYGIVSAILIIFLGGAVTAGKLDADPICSVPTIMLSFLNHVLSIHAIIGASRNLRNEDWLWQFRFINAP